MGHLSDIPSYDTFYVSWDNTECGSHGGISTLLMGCGNKQESNIPIAPSYCDTFSHAIAPDLMQSDPQEVQEWYVAADKQGSASLDKTIMKRSTNHGGLLCCIDSKWNKEEITWSKWELVLLAIAHAIFVVIFVLTLAVMCERIIRYSYTFSFWLSPSEYSLNDLQQHCSQTCHYQKNHEEI